MILLLYLQSLVFWKHFFVYLIFFESILTPAVD